MRVEKEQQAIKQKELLEEKKRIEALRQSDKEKEMKEQLEKEE